MITIPQRLLDLPFVNVWHHGSHCTVLSKRIKESLHNRQSYVSRHAVSIVLSGYQRIHTENGESIELEAGEIGFIRKGIYTVTDLVSASGEFEAFLMYLSDDLLSQVLDLETDSAATQLMPTSFFGLPAPGIFSAYRRDMQAMLQRLGKPGESWFRVKILEFFALYHDENPEAGLFDQLRRLQVQAPQNLLQFMELHFDKPLNVEDYAYLTGRSLSTFRREFKARFDITPRKWIIRRRMEKAQKLMDNPDLNISDIAMQVGYENTSHFIQVFKRVFGKTPGRQALNSQPFN